MRAYLKGHLYPFPCRVASLWRHDRGLSYTASGYGRKIPTPYRVLFKGRDRRIYCAQFGNVGTCYIVSRGQWIIVENIEAKE